MSLTTAVFLIIGAYVLGAIAFAAGGIFLVHDGHPVFAIGGFAASALMVLASSSVEIKTTPRPAADENREKDA